MLSMIFASRYVLGTVAVGYFAYPWIMAAAAMLNKTAETLASIPGLAQ